MTTITSDADRAAFEAWFQKAGIWNESIAEKAWIAACAWMRGISEQTKNDEPRNVDGKTRAEFESYLRTCYQHDNVRAQESGLGPKWPNGQIGLTPEDEREIAERVERSYPTRGTFACPICGKDVPHEHSAEDIVAHRNKQKACATIQQSKGLTDAELPTLSCIAPSCHQWDGGSTCTCQRMQALVVLQGAVTALSVLKSMLGKEGLAGVEVVEEMIKNMRAIISALQPTAEPGKEGE